MKKFASIELSKRCAPLLRSKDIDGSKLISTVNDYCNEKISGEKAVLFFEDMKNKTTSMYSIGLIEECIGIIKEENV